MTSPSIDSIETIVEDTLSAIALIEEMSSDHDGSLKGYKTLCSQIPDHARAGLIRVAVVGVIKSGKSTFINALTGKELVKRGAGVVTSITTRIRKGKKNRAVIHLKSWDEINRSIEKVLDYFPQDLPEEHFDMRRKKDRAYLQSVYDSLIGAFPITREGIRPETLVVRNALEGYASCRDIIEADQRALVYESRAFDRHKEFTADPARAFYVKDVCLEIFGKSIPVNVEVADCQGADSTDPAQLAQIISYIESANLIVYCISSRTGLRRSDMGFLKTINRLGLMKNILFVNNIDLTEHESFEDLTRIRDNIHRELKLVVPDPQLFSFSALYILFESMGNRLKKRNAKRFSLWKDDPGMTGFCAKNHRAFLEIYTRLLETRQFDLLFANHLERLKIVARALDNKIKIMEGLLADDQADRDNARDQLEDIEENARRLRVIVDNSIQGAVSGLTREIETNLKNAFLKDTINITQKVTRFINRADIDVTQYRSGVKETGFKQILYLMFQDFKRQLDCFALEQLVPELKRLVAVQEKRIEEYFQSLLDSYQIDFLTKTGRKGDTGHFFPDELLEKDPGGIRAVDITAIKKILGLRLPDQVFTAHYTTRMKTHALTDFGGHSILLFIGALVDRHVHFSFTPGLHKAAGKIKKESLKLVRQQVQGYHLALKQDYFIPLIRAVTRDFKDKIIQRFSLYENLTTDLESFFELKADEKTRRREKIRILAGQIHNILRAIEDFSLERPLS